MATVASAIDFFPNEIMFEECPIPLDHTTIQEKHSSKKCWHSINDIHFRRELLIHLFRIICSSRPQLTPGILNLCCRLEKQLYHRAASQEEYCQVSTLKRRLKSLAFSIADSTTIIRKKNTFRFAVEQDVSQRSLKRVRFTKKLDLNSQEVSIFLVSNNDRAIEHIYSYLDPIESIKHRQVNRFAACFLVNCVKYLKIDLVAARLALNTNPVGTIFREFPRLRALSIYNRSTRALSCNEDISNLFSFCPNLSINTEDRAEDVAILLSEAITAGAFTKLESLQLNSVFINSREYNGVARLAVAIQTGNCPNLRELQLGGNCAGDDAAIAIAQLMLSKACKSLAHIDLRNNFIGQRGGTALAVALAECECIHLENLCLGGNILIDSNFADFAAALSSMKGKRPRFIGLEGNFISYGAMVGLSQVLSSCNILFVNRDDANCS